MGRAVDAKCYIDYGNKTKVVLGVDVARSATGDTSYVYSFTTGLMHDWVLRDGDLVMSGVGEAEGGVLRFVDKWRGVPLTDRYEADGSFTIGQATLLHQHALALGASEVRIDKGGIGWGLIDGLWLLARGQYSIIEMMSGDASPDIHLWINNRAYQLDQMAGRFAEGLIDIDPLDKVLITQLEDVIYENVDPHGAKKIESKDALRKRGFKSPDAADAAWYACADLTHLTEGPLAGKKIGDVLEIDPWANRSRAGMPI
jgi:hypothetical protein